MLFKKKTVNNIVFHRLGNPMVLNKTLITGVLILCLVVFQQASAQNNSLFSPVIQVNDTVITKFEFDQRVKFLSALKFPGDPNKVAQTQLIEERLKQTEALKLKITASEPEIENELKFSAFISDAVVIGDKRKFLSCLIMIDEENVMKFAQDHDVPFSNFESLCKSKEIIELIQLEVNQVNKKFANVEQVKKFTLIDVQLTAEDDELTPTMKLKRKFINQKYTNIIEAMYKTA